jgi:hypothetical protein
LLHDALRLNVVSPRRMNGLGQADASTSPQPSSQSSWGYRFIEAEKAAHPIEHA